MRRIIKEAAKEMGCGSAAAGAGAGSIFCTGGSFSAAGITGGLATLGAGSMLLGIGTVAVIGIGAYKTTQYLMEKFDGDEEQE